MREVNNMVKVVLGYPFSDEIVREYAKRKGFTLYAYYAKREPSEGINLKRFVRATSDTATRFRERFLTKDYGEEVHKDEIDPKDIFFPSEISRTDPDLVSVVENIKPNITKYPNATRVVEIPDGVEWELVATDIGFEYIAEKHRTWD